MSAGPPLPPEVLAELFAHARAGYPEEVCGLIIADQEVRRCENQQNALHASDPAAFPRDARSAYSLAPADLFFLDRSLSSARPVTLVYHSHVEVGPGWSDEDTRAAAPGGEPLYPVEHLVIDVTTSGVHGARRYRFVGGRYVEVGSYAP